MSHRLGVPVLGSYAEETPLAGWRTAGVKQKGYGKLDLISEEHICWLALKVGQRGLLTGSCLVFKRLLHCSGASALAQAKCTLPALSPHTTAGHWI